MLEIMAENPAVSKVRLNSGAYDNNNKSGVFLVSSELFPLFNKTDFSGKYKHGSSTADGTQKNITAKMKIML